MSFGRAPQPPLATYASVLKPITLNTSGSATGSNSTRIVKALTAAFVAAVTSGRSLQITFATNGVVATIPETFVGLMAVGGGWSFDGNQQQVTWNGQKQLVTAAGITSYTSDAIPFVSDWPPERHLLIAFSVNSGSVIRFNAALNSAHYSLATKTGVQEPGVTTKTGYTITSARSDFFDDLLVAQ